MMLLPRIPLATYRLQFNQNFTFKDATPLIEYLADLGISDLYASPLQQARPGSMHGYDICDPTQLNPALGSVEEFDGLIAALKERDMGLLLDTVPNHMGIGDVCNQWWIDVLENGPSSPYSRFFDIDWDPVKPEFQNKVLLPMLEDQYGAVLESGKLRLVYEEGAFWISYYALRLPVAPGTYNRILSRCLEALDSDSVSLGANPPGVPTAEGQEPVTDLATPVVPAVLMADPDSAELQSILTSLNHLPSRLETDPQRVAERYREKEVIKRRLAALYKDSEKVRQCLDETVIEFNGQPGDPRSFDLLDELLEVQVYRPAFWRVAGEEINYRRFFDINDLAAVRVESPEVFAATHQLVLRLLKEGKVTGLRIDHPDGLWDPPTYFRRLQESYVKVMGAEGPSTGSGPAEEPRSGGVGLSKAEHEQGSGGAISNLQSPISSELPLYVVAEKILSEREPLPENWAVFGTTGYDFLASVNNLMVHGANREAFDRIYTEFTGQRIVLEDLAIQAKMLIMRDSLSSEINALSHQLERIGERNRHYRDFTLNGITSALREVIACLPVYRTYINALTGEVPEQDRRYVEMAVRRARRRRPGLADAIFDFIRDTLLLRNTDNFREEDRAELRNFVMKFQQLTGPVMAKGVEDTAFYIFNRLVSLNEVGSSPDLFGVPAGQFHRDNQRRAQRWPHSLLATSTHDNKRSEDVRARLDVLSEIPEAWRAALGRWSRLNNAKKTMVDGVLAPDRNDEYLLYLTLLGTWPIAEGGRKTDVSQEERLEEWRREGTGAKPGGSDAALTRDARRVEQDDEPAGTDAEPLKVPSGKSGAREGSRPAGSGASSPGDNGRAAAEARAAGVGRQPLGDTDLGDGAQTVASELEKKPAVFENVPPDWGGSGDAGEEPAGRDPWGFLLRPNDPGFEEFRQRIAAYLQKAVNEAKVHTSWINPDAEYDQALQAFVEGVLDPAENRHFLEDLAPLAQKVAYYGQFNSLTQTLLKLTSPGVPDIYQGQEMWDFSLVDPDNRRPVDYDLRRARLAEVRGAVERLRNGERLDLAEELLERASDGTIKLYVVACALAFRSAHRPVFDTGDYVPLEAQGAKAEYVTAFARRSGEKRVLAVAPRLPVGVSNDLRRPPLGQDAWDGTWLALPGEQPGARYRNVFTNEILKVGAQEGQPGLPMALVLGHFPVALMERLS